MRCLEKRPVDRPPSADEVATLLLQLLLKHTARSSDVLLRAALTRAGLAEDYDEAGDADPGVAPASSLWQRRFLVSAAVVGLVGLCAVALWLALRGDPSDAGQSPQGVVERPARLRVLADPWAEVHIDGQLVDVTPVGRLIEVMPGKHTVVLKHPNAPDERRNIEVIAGETVLIDVEMQITRPEDAGAPLDGGEDEDASPPTRLRSRSRRKLRPSTRLDCAPPRGDRDS
jgi:serine/threonine-protein kinase